MIVIRKLGLQPYQPIWEKMKNFTQNRTKNTLDECWLLEHLAVYTQGQAGKSEHIFNSGSIPIVQSDRGGQVTYHGPGQLVIYTLIDLNQRNMGIRTLVSTLEKILISLLKEYGVNATTYCKAPGVYVNDKKIASIGLRVKNACTYHGIAFNISMDLSPFEGINPCGFENLQMTQLSDYIPGITVAEVATRLEMLVINQFNS